jgi:hypothetical protein
MAGRQLTSFEQILLGLICMAPASGYDLKRVFASTPMGVYQPSSGALYPALRRLELGELIRTQAGRPPRQPPVGQAHDRRAVRRPRHRQPPRSLAVSVSPIMTRHHSGMVILSLPSVTACAVSASFRLCARA